MTVEKKRFILLYFDADNQLQGLSIERDLDWDPQAEPINAKDFGLLDDDTLFAFVEAGLKNASGWSTPEPSIYRIQMDAATELTIEEETSQEGMEA